MIFTPLHIVCLYLVVEEDGYSVKMSDMILKNNRK